MSLARVRLIAAAILFLAWIGWLAYLARWHAAAVAVSRSQLLVATSLVVGKVTVDQSGSPSASVEVLESIGANPIAAGTSISVENLDQAKLPAAKKLAAGAYLLPLVASATGRYRVPPAPRGPSSSESGPCLVYPWNAEVERQAHELVR